MQSLNDKTSSEKENKKVQTDEQFKDNEVREGTEAYSINTDNDINESAYPFPNEKDKQHDENAEFIDRNSNSKDKS